MDNRRSKLGVVRRESRGGTRGATARVNPPSPRRDRLYGGRMAELIALAVIGVFVAAALLLRWYNHTHPGADGISDGSDHTSAE